MACFLLFCLLLAGCAPSSLQEASSSVQASSSAVTSVSESEVSESSRATIQEESTSCTTSSESEKSFTEEASSEMETPALSVQDTLEGSKEEEQAIEDVRPEKAAENIVTIHIACGETMILSAYQAEVTEKQSVFGLLKQATKSEKIHMDFSGSGSTAYVRGIANVYEFDKGPESGWMFRVNGDFSSTGCGAYMVEAGDVIEWLYTEDMGKDIGAAVA